MKTKSRPRCVTGTVAGAAHWGREIAAEAASMLAEGLGFEAFQALHEAQHDETVRAAFEEREQVSGRTWF